MNFHPMQLIFFYYLKKAFPDENNYYFNYVNLYDFVSTFETKSIW